MTYKEYNLPTKCDAEPYVTLKNHMDIKIQDRLCGLVVTVSGYKSNSGFDSRRYEIFFEVLGLQRGPLILVRITEELLECESTSSGIENRD
jgi:hypothetical protein